MFGVNLRIFSAVEHWNAECVGHHVCGIGSRYAALEPIAMGVQQYYERLEDEGLSGNQKMRRNTLPVLVWLCAAVIVVFLFVVERRTTMEQGAEKESTSTQQAVAEPNGAQLYAQQCATCHGETGLGNGLAAQILFPKPRDFTRGKYKIRSTRFGDLPTDQDIFNTIRRGITRSAMPSFAHLSEGECWALTAHLKKLAVYTTEAGQEVRPFEVAGQRIVEISYEPAVTEKTIARGKQAYRKAECYRCHGDTGAGDGPWAKDLKDDWGNPIVPCNFQRGVYKGGGDKRDIFLRCTTGMAGTPMRSFEDVLPSDERWALAHYVRSLADPKSVVRQSGQAKIVAQKVSESLTLNSLARVWDEIGAVELPLMLTIQRQEAAGLVSVKAACDGTSIALLLEWEDSSVNSSLSGTEDFVDGAAIQFSPGSPPARFAMGEKGKPVNIWSWRMDHQMDTTRYVEAEDALFQPARFTAVENLTAEGIGTLAPLPEHQQTVQGYGVWVSGKWRVVFLRGMRNSGEGEIQVQSGQTIYAAFGVWDGAHEDRGGSKAVTFWQILEIEN